MKPECQKIIDLVLSSKPMAMEVKKHIESCSTCQQLRKSVEALSVFGTMFPEKPTIAQKQEFLRRLGQTKANNNNNTRLWDRTPQIALYGLVGVTILGLVIIGFVPTHEILWSSKANINEKIAREDSIVHNSESSQIASGVRSLVLADGSHLEVRGLADFNLNSRYLSIKNGIFRVAIASSTVPFEIITNYGKIKTNHGEVVLEVNSLSSIIEVASGIIELTTQDGKSGLIQKGTRVVLAQTSTQTNSASQSIALPVSSSEDIEVR